MKGKKLLALGMVGVLGVSILSGCKLDDVEENGGSVSAMVFDYGLVSAAEGTYEENRWTQWIAEN